MASIFISHSRSDTEIRDSFQKIFGRTEVKANLVEYEQFHPPAWFYIQQQIAASATLFVLLGPEMASLAHTQVWVGSETGAVLPPKEVWVFEHHQNVSGVPIPNTHHYMPYSFEIQDEEYIKAIIESYDDSPIIPGVVAGGLLGAPAGPPGILVGALFGGVAANPAKNRPMGVPVKCPNQGCQSGYRLHRKVDLAPCPVCRTSVRYDW